MKSIRARILLTFLLISLALMSISGFWHYQTIHGFAIKAFADNARTITIQIARRAITGVFSEDPEQLKKIASDSFLITSLDCLKFFNDKKKLIWHFHKNPSSSSDNDSFFPGLDPSFFLDENYARVISPVILEDLEFGREKGINTGKVIGYIACKFNLLAIHQELESVTWSFFLAEIIIALVFGFFIIFLERWVTKPLVLLIEKVKEIAGGDLMARINVVSRDEEIGLLGHNINQMADSLQKHTEGLTTIIDSKTREIKIRERQMMFQEKMASLGQMSANIAHEINNPLNYVALGLDFLELREEKMFASEGKSFIEDYPERKKVFANIRHGFSRMKGIVDSMRKFSRTDETQIQEYFFQEVYLDTHRIFEHELKNLSVNLTSRIHCITPFLGSIVRTQQILLNLFRNSLDAFEESHTSDPAIRIEVREEAGKALIHFEDNGPGILPEHQSRIFEPFFTTKPPGKGTGIGLALCFELAAREGGTIKLGMSDTGGAAFDIAIPLKG